jgi:uncharacterized membrane protein YcjF (UPF0283 family)
MLVLASTVVTVVIVIAVVVVVGVLFVALGPLSPREQLRDDVGAEMGPMGTGRISEETQDELRDASGLPPRAGGDHEERLDREDE